MERRARILAACASCLLLDGVAFAAEPVPPSAAGPAAEMSPSGEDRAAAAFQRSLEAYEARDLPAALAAMRESLRLSGRAELLYNIARIEDELGDCAEASADYREYLSRVPDGRYRAEAERASQDLSQRCPPAAADTALPTPLPETAAKAAPAAVWTPAPAAPALEPPRREPASARDQSHWPPSALGYGAIALGVVAGASSIYFMSKAVDAHDDLKASIRKEVAGGPHADLDLRDEQHRYQTWAQVLAVSGGALVAGGVIIVVLAPRKNSQAASVTQLRLAPSQVSLFHEF